VFAFGTIVLVRFPFTDLSGDKRRPALVVSCDNFGHSDLIVCFITSVPRSGPHMAPIAATPATGLKLPSVVRFDKIATLGRLSLASWATLRLLGLPRSGPDFLGCSGSASRRNPVLPRKRPFNNWGRRPRSSVMPSPRVPASAGSV
jgi:mRNA interferase MazF